MMKRTLSVIIACLLLSVPICVSAATNTTSEPTAGKSVYVAGNPDLFPFEYYDTKSKTYRGILPELYDDISERTGLDFTYIKGGIVNNQSRLAKNCQAELISAHLSGDVEELSEVIQFLTYEKDGKTFTVCIGFTEIADADTVKLIRDAVESISESELLSRVIQSSVQPPDTVSALYLVVGICVLFVIIGILIILAVRNRNYVKKITKDKFTDPLTGIGNEKHFSQKYDYLVTPASYSLYYVIYICINVQRIEKYFGTGEAEDLERFAADIISSSISDSDFCAKIGDGVFLCACQFPSEDDAYLNITELLSKLNSYNDKIEDEYRTKFRAGVFHLSSPGTTLETAVFNARQGYVFAHKNKLLYKAADKDMLNRETTKIKLERKLGDAIKNNEFNLYLQFIVDTKSGSIKGAEALSRWNNPEDGILTPAHYIDAMCASGTIEHLDFYIFEEVCRQLTAWSDTDKKDLWISCNFTRTTVSKSNFWKRFEEIANRYSFDRSKLVIELTEDTLADDKALAYQNILSCKKAGFKVALDDLGSGYSSFSDLCDYPIDMIKIDRHIVVKSTTPRGNALMCGITRLAHDLKMKVLCEGVTNENENKNAIDSGCDYIQGFYYSRVLPKEEAETFFAKYRNKNIKDNLNN